MRDYLKLLLMAVATALIAGRSYISDDVLTSGEKVQILAAFFGAIAVGVSADLVAPLWRYTKTIAAGAAALFVAWGAELENGPGEMGANGWWNVAIAVLAALGVGAVTAAGIGPFRRGDRVDPPAVVSRATPA